MKMFCPADKHELEFVGKVPGSTRLGIFKCPKCGQEWGIERIEDNPLDCPFEHEDEAEFCHECNDFTVIDSKCHECGTEYDDR